MKKLLILFLIPLFVQSSESPFTAEIDSLIRAGTTQTFHNQYDSAFATFGEIDRRLPEHPVGAFYMAATLQSKMMNYETGRWEQAFTLRADSAIACGERQLTLHPDDAWIHFYLGNTYSYRGLYQAKRGSLVGGFKSARRGIDHLKTAIELDSTLYDAYLGVGNYMYWSGKFYKYLRFLPWIRDERDKGIIYVRKAVDLGLYSGWVGLNSLAWIEYDRGDCDSALLHFSEGDSAFPNSPFWLWGLAETQKKCEMYVASIQSYQAILSIVTGDSLESGLNELIARYKMMLSLYEIGQYQEAVRQADLALAVVIESSEIDRAEDYRSKVAKLRKQCDKKIQK